jgi:hypothetical protein
MAYLTKLLAIRERLNAADLPTTDPARIHHLKAELNQAIDRQLEVLKINSKIQ